MPPLIVSSPVFNDVLDKETQVSVDALAYEWDAQHANQDYFRKIAEESLARFKQDPERFAHLK